MSTRILVVDNYDSFVFNLVQYLAQLGAEVEVKRNDAIAPEAGRDYDGVLVSPGPGTPADAGVCMDMIRLLGGEVPIFGVCLGHQAIGDAYGGHVIRAPEPIHGKLAQIEHEGQTIFRGLNGPFMATRYHSLVVERATMPTDLMVTAQTSDGLVMGLSHRSRPVHGVQFHPESILSEHGHLMLQNFLDLAKAWNEGPRAARA